MSYLFINFDLILNGVVGDVCLIIGWKVNFLFVTNSYVYVRTYNNLKCVQLLINSNILRSNIK